MVWGGSRGERAGEHEEAAAGGEIDIKRRARRCNARRIVSQVVVKGTEFGEGLTTGGIGCFDAWRQVIVGDEEDLAGGVEFDSDVLESGDELLEGAAGFHERGAGQRGWRRTSSGGCGSEDEDAVDLFASGEGSLARTPRPSRRGLTFYQSIRRFNLFLRVLEVIHGVAMQNSHPQPSTRPMQPYIECLHIGE